ncbi:MAG: hypothetical protein ABL958_13525 [Bdellovibrionia bacterium]
MRSAIFSLLFLTAMAPAQDPVTNEQLKVVTVTAGSISTCVLLSNKKVKCWGGDVDYEGSSTGDQAGEMGDKLPYRNFGQGVQVDRLFGGNYSNCAYTSDKKLLCWGTNMSGTLGVENPDYKFDNTVLPMAETKLGKTAPLKDLSIGLYNMCALFDDGRMKCWGWNQNGQTGNGDTKPHGSGPNQMGDKLPYVNLGKNLKVSKVSVGSYHVCALLTDGRVKCFGTNQMGELGYGDTSYRGWDAKHMGDNLDFTWGKCKTLAS